MQHDVAGLSRSTSRLAVRGSPPHLANTISWMNSSTLAPVNADVSTYEHAPRRLASWMPSSGLMMLRHDSGRVLHRVRVSSVSGVDQRVSARMPHRMIG